jgi:glycine hydroxymethyltransferase
MSLDDFLFRGSLADLDPDVAELVNLEAERQAKRLIMIPSSATIPEAVKEALRSHFHNIYAEGYPLEETRRMSQDELLDIDMQLAEYRRYGDARYYKGAEFANVLEALTRRRGAELYATDKYGPDQLYVNVQPLSGAPANSAVYTALINPGDTIMGMNLLHGGHLTHGSPVARSGKQYKVIWYGVNAETELLDYDEALRLAREGKPKIIVGGYTSYPWSPDWARLRAIADEVGALLMADIAHVAGLVAAGVYPSPVGIADIVTFTTHKTLGGPRGAVIITHRADLYKKLDRGVFPGEQGGPHVNGIAALAVAFKLAGTARFRTLQGQMVRNAMTLASELSRHGLRIVHGGTNTHLLLIDCKTIRGTDGTTLSGDIAARLLDLAGIVCNRNTIPGDTAALFPSGVRLGTPWITQRGFGEAEIVKLAAIIANLLKAAHPFAYMGADGKADARAKIGFAALMEARQQVAALCDVAGVDFDLPYAGDTMPSKGRTHLAMGIWGDTPNALAIRGPQAANFLRYATTASVYELSAGSAESAHVLDAEGQTLAEGALEMVADNHYRLHLSSGDAKQVSAWLTALSDGFIGHDAHDIYGKIPGPVVVSHLFEATAPTALQETNGGADKPYFVGARAIEAGNPLPVFAWQEPTNPPLLRTPLYELHKQLGAKIVPFAGYEMPVWYSGVSQEHAAVRKGAGLFDVSHMGVWEFSGSAAEYFLQNITSNDVTALAPGQAQYSYLLGLDGVPLDDIYVYRLGNEQFMVVVNASNNDKDWLWVNGLLHGHYQIDPTRPSARIMVGAGELTLRDLRNPDHGPDQRVDIALQGPQSLNILLGLAGSDADKKKVKALAWSTVTQVNLVGYDLIISRTGYTGERIAYELFPHPEQAAALFQTLIAAGATPCGLASRDSTRIEAGLPLYGHELGGEYTPADAGFGGYIKLWKPFFVGKLAYLAREAKREAVITRFRMENKGVRAPQPGAAILDRRGRVVGIVTSCSIDSEGYQLGQAYLKLEFAKEGTAIMVINPNQKEGGGKAGYTMGDKLTVPDAAVVLSKFPARKK